MSNRKHTTRQLATLAILVAALAQPRHAAAESVDDTFLLSTRVAPNIVLFVDNSLAMTQIEWHPAFDPAAASTCSHFDPNTVYSTASLLPVEFHCGNLRTIFRPIVGTLWDGRYLNWYFSDAADAHITEILTSVASIASCNTAGALNLLKFQRTRADAVRQVLTDTLCLAATKGLRIGLTSFRSPADAGNVDPNGGYVSVPVEDFSVLHTAQLVAKLGLSGLSPAAPLSETLFQLYTYLMPRSAGSLPLGNDGVTSFPAYAYDATGAVPALPGQVLPDPVQYSCQKNYIILVTTGVSSRDDFDRDPLSTSQGYDHFAALIGDYWSDGEVENPGGPSEGTLYVDDIAKFMRERDLRPDFPDLQSADLYTIGFGTSTADDALLERAAELGNGLFFHAQDGVQLATALVSSLNDVSEKSRSFTSATVPSARTADGSDFYNSFFLPSSRSAFWEGHLRAWHFSAAGEILDSNGNCALVDPDGGTQCNDGPFQTICQPGQTTGCAVPFWEAGDHVPPPGSANGAGVRTLYTSLLSGASPPAPVRTAFGPGLTAANLAIQTFTAPGSPAPNSLQYAVKGSTAQNAEGLADEVVAYARGCTFGTGVQTADVAAGVACEARSWRLGDIFHSDPILVRNPAQRPLGTAYDTFRAAYTDRDRVIYAGTNGGYLEAIHAGDWDAVASRYDEGTGVELFGFMPWEPRTRIKNQPIDDPANRTHYVDGAPAVADAWLYETATDGVQDADDWRTVLVGGLRKGGRHYYALDVTNPSGDASAPAGNLPYPGLLWEFPNEHDANSGTGDYADMGQTWGQAVLTRVKLKVGGNSNGGQGFERWVAITSGGYDVTSDPNPASVDPSAGYVSGSKKGRSIYILDLETGKVIAQQKVGAAAPQNGMQYALVSTPGVLDLDADGFADVIYIGDLGGNLWKWAIHEIGEDRANDGSGLRTQPAWKFQKSFSAPTVTVSGSIYYKNVFQPPAAAYVGNKLWVVWGTGERAAIGFEGIAGQDENNRFYAIHDSDPYAQAATTPAVLTEADLTNITTPGTPVTSGQGYFLKTADGEKFVSSTAIFGGQVITASFTPPLLDAGDPGFDPCTQRGNGSLYVFDLASGEGSFTDGSGNESRFVDIGSGLPTDPRISIGVGGSDNKIVIQQSGTDVEILDAEDIDFGRGIIYWRELH